MIYLSRGSSPVINHAPRTFRTTARLVMCFAKRCPSRIRSQLRTVTRETRHAVAISGIPTPAITIAARTLPENVSLIPDDAPLIHIFNTRTHAPIPTVRRVAREIHHGKPIKRR